MVYLRCLSTGVIQRSASAVLARVQILNLTNRPIQVSVLAFDWDTNPPETLTVTPGSPFIIPAFSNQTFDIPLGAVTNNYEIRIAIPRIRDVIANVFTLDAAGNVLAGNTVFFDNLIPVSSCLLGDNIENNCVYGVQLRS